MSTPGIRPSLLPPTLPLAEPLSGEPEAGGKTITVVDEEAEEVNGRAAAVEPPARAGPAAEDTSAVQTVTGTVTESTEEAAPSRAPTMRQVLKHLQLPGDRRPWLQHCVDIAAAGLDSEGEKTLNDIIVMNSFQLNEQEREAMVEML